MTLIKSISGIRGTIGDPIGQGLTPMDIVESVAGYGQWLLKQRPGRRPSVVIGRDGRMSGEIVLGLAIHTLRMQGIDVYDADLSTTPTIEMAVKWYKARGGIIITASHNPANWNALKFLNHRGEFISAQDGEHILDTIKEREMSFAEVENLGRYQRIEGLIERHIASILDMEWVQQEVISKKKYHIVVDCINSTGALSVPPLLEALGCTYTLINDTVNGRFEHNPEPLTKNLQSLSRKVVTEHADLGIAVDPDVDRLVFMNENGTPFNEEYTLVAIADYILSLNSGDTVSNLSSTRALADITIKHGGEYHASAVGEVNVVALMKSTNAVIGGEGNGGVIVPPLHYGRDALAGIALFLSGLAKRGGRISQWKEELPHYEMYKDRLDLNDEWNLDAMLEQLAQKYQGEAEVLTIDGTKILFKTAWVHLRPSNTEPIVRIYTEAKTSSEAKQLAEQFKAELLNLA